MKRFQRLLVGVDLTLEGDAVTSGSRRAAQQARWLARHTGASLTFLHSTWADLYEDHNVIRHGPSPAGERALQELAAEFGDGDDAVELVFVEDRAWMAMIRRVLRGESDFVFVARRNQPGSIALGSTSRKLMRKCPCPVWVVNPDAELLRGPIMAATDLTAVGDLAVQMAAYLARACDGELHVVHAWQVPFEVQLSRRSQTEQAQALEDIQRRAEEHIRTALARSEPGVTPRMHVSCNSPSKAISAGVERVGAHLLVMGTVAPGGAAGLLIGNTAERLLDRVACSLLTIKPSDFVSPVR